MPLTGMYQQLVFRANDDSADQFFLTGLKRQRTVC